jgi:hypothetical protein
MAEHLIGMLLGTEEDWPAAFEAMIGRAGLRIEHGGDTHTFSTERITIEPFSLHQGARHSIVIDRLAYWYYHPREWLKKIALMDGVYLMNNPFTFQSMEKHSAYCMLIRLGLHVPETWLIPPKEPLDNTRWAYTSAKYNQQFDLPSIAEQLGYPMFMKPFDGGGWRGVSRVTDPQQLNAAYDESGRELMHLQEAIDFDVFARTLTIGAEQRTLRYDPSQPMHGRYSVDHEFLDADTGYEVDSVSRMVNAIFRWEFNSAECLVADGVVHPIDYANACPDVALTSLHYYFPWAISALVKWSVFCTVTGRRARLTMDLDPWFEIADTSSSHEERMARYRELADEELDAAPYEEFVDEHLSHLDEVMWEYVGSPDFDDLLVATVTSTFPEHEHEEFIAHYRGLLGMWHRDAAA